MNAEYASNFVHSSFFETTALVLQKGGSKGIDGAIAGAALALFATSGICCISLGQGAYQELSIAPGIAVFFMGYTVRAGIKCGVAYGLAKGVFDAMRGYK